jgi:hypothetical protein
MKKDLDITDAVDEAIREHKITSPMIKRMDYNLNYKNRIYATIALITFGGAGVAIAYNSEIVDYLRTLF